MVLPVIGDPLDDRPLHRHAAEDPERDLDGQTRLEAFVREVAVEADRRAERAQHVEATSSTTSSHRKARPHSITIASPAPRSGTITAKTMTTRLMRLVPDEPFRWATTNSGCSREGAHR